MSKPIPAALLFTYRNTKSWPRSPGRRFLVSAALGILVWIFPPWGLLGTALAMAVLSWANRLNPGLFLRSLKSLWFLIAFPLLVSLLHPSWENSLDGLFRSTTVLVLFWTSHWFTSCTSLEEIRIMSRRFFGIFGSRISSILELTLAMTIAFIPWIFAESWGIREAMILRAPRASRVRQISFFGIPLLLRLFQKVRQTSDAMELRNGSGLD